MDSLKYKHMHSPVGLLKLVADHSTLVAILWDNEKLNRVKLDPMLETETDPFLLSVEEQLNEYFQGTRKKFTIELETIGTPFQKAVWKLLLEIPYGTTCSYNEIAHKLNNPRAVRAVGGAIGRNPLSVVIPCHRVIGAKGALTGFAGGVERKQLLLNLEKLGSLD